MSESNFESVVSVLPVKDHPVAVAWYQKWIGRVPDSEPTEGVSEWLLAENAWIQVSLDPEPAGQTTVIIGVKSIDVQRATCSAVGVSVGEINDYGFIMTAEAIDPEGNKIVFVQVIQES